MIWSASVYWINPRDYDKKEEILKLLFPDNLDKEENTYEYDEIKEQNMIIKLKLRIDSVGNNRYGKFANILIDHPIRLWNMDRGPYRAVVSVKTILQYFDTPDVKDYFVCVGGKFKAHLLFKALNIILRKIYKLEKPFLPVEFSLTDKIKDLKGKTGPLTSIGIKNIQDIYIHEAKFSGVQLEESEEFKKYVEDQHRSGIIHAFAINYSDREIFVMADGTIFTRQGKKEFEPEVIYEILKLFEELNVIKKYSTLDKFFS